MRQKLAIFTLFGAVVLVLVGLNAATYVQKEKTPDNEFSPNRSTFNSGTTGSQAFFALLSETGHSVTRWQVPVAELPASVRNKPATFVLIGPRLKLTDLEQSDILKWVAEGGRLVLIDRDPPEKLLVSEPWSLTVEKSNDPGILAVDPSDVTQMTTGATAARVVQPSSVTAGLNAVQPSRLASSIGFKRNNYNIRTDVGAGGGTDDLDESTNRPNGTKGDEFTVTGSPGDVPSPAAVGPMLHVAAGDKNLVVDVPYGLGRIILLSDPYVISNAGIGLVDNATLALNLVSGGGPIAFDEYHQGYGTNNNQLVRYFEGTPVIAIFLQLAALVALVLFSQSRRFARPLPDIEPDRLSKLEYISAMAELQQRTAAYDLAIENIYHDFRRRASRFVGADNTVVKRPELARLVAERAKLPAAEVDELMFKCEDVIHGEPTDRKETLELLRQLRELESKLGLGRASRAKI